MGTDCRNIAIREVIIIVSLKITDFCDMMPCSPVQWKLLSIIRTGDGSRFVPYVCTYIWDQMASLPTRQLSLQQRHCSEVLKQWQILKKKKMDHCLRRSAKTADRCCLTPFPHQSCKTLHKNTFMWKYLLPFQDQFWQLFTQSSAEAHLITLSHLLTY